MHMQIAEAEETEKSSLTKIRKVCSSLCFALKALFVVFCIGWLFSSGAIFYSLINPESFDAVNNSTPLSVVLCLAYGFIVAIMFLIFIAMFSDASKGESPFTMAQVRRLRLISAMLVLYVIVDSVASLGIPFTQVNSVDLGYASVTGNTIIPINFAPIIAAAVVFAFSFVFKYGVLLQEFSDDAI